ncbi:hypothetical protein [Bounagaea algeriensis]
MSYSGAPRCANCDNRAILDRRTAERLTTESAGLLVAYDCPAGYGVHVWNPDFERLAVPGVD